MPFWGVTFVQSFLIDFIRKVLRFYNMAKFFEISTSPILYLPNCPHFPPTRNTQHFYLFLFLFFCFIFKVKSEIDNLLEKNTLYT